MDTFQAAEVEQQEPPDHDGWRAVDADVAFAVTHDDHQDAQREEHGRRRVEDTNVRFEEDGEEGLWLKVDGQPLRDRFLVLRRHGAVDVGAAMFAWRKVVM